MVSTPPVTEQELMDRALSLAGKTLQYLAVQESRTLPARQTRSKGMIGELLEHYLGATAGPLPEPDFQHIGVELKTIPVSGHGKPRESTYVCTVSLLPTDNNCWEDSLVKRKLNRVLWVPIEADPEIPLHARKIGTPVLWSPSAEQEYVLRHDWHELTDMIMTGDLEKISARFGKYLQIRPKAQNARSLQMGIDHDGGISRTLPRGYYLRTSFTGMILDYRSV